MNDAFQIETPGVDVEKVMAEIRRRVEAKRARGVYNQFSLADAGHEHDTIALKQGNEYFDYYLKSLLLAAEIDINDFEIASKSRFFGRPVVGLKKLIWKLLKFYTFRMFSQQRDFNARVAVILQGMDRRYSRKLAQLEDRIKSLDEDRS
ncbi:MAG: hypothetical protein P9M08_10650 [Candidatus Erginobacter occultus]|nr:hypothetical protein [Candidatus Erginobacter occultus]